MGLGKFVKSSYIPICPGLSGQIGALEINYTHQPDKSTLIGLQNPASWKKRPVILACKINEN